MILCVSIIILFLSILFAHSTPPNIVLFIADDLGYGDIGRFGNTTLRTPNVDRIGAEGATLTQHISAASMCTPSRTAFLTGRYPVRAGMGATSGEEVIKFVGSSAGLPDTEITFAKLVKSAGYRTALIGKWHQGLSCYRTGDHCYHPNKHGFDHFYGIPLSNMPEFGDEPVYMLLLLSPGHDKQMISACVITALFIAMLRYFKFIGYKMMLILFIMLETPFLYQLFVLFNCKRLNSILMRQEEIVEQPIELKTLASRFVQESVEFMEAADRDRVPFLLFFAWHHPHTALVTMDDFAGKSQHGKYGDVVEEMDWGIGEVMKLLDEKGLSDNTVVYFTSDNGAFIRDYGHHGDMQAGFNGIYSGGKSYPITEGGIRVPAVIKWPGRIQPGTYIHQATSLMDLFPTIAHVSGTELPSGRTIDGMDLMPLLAGNNSSHHEFLFHYCASEVHAVRYMPRGTNEVYKLVYREQTGTPSIYQCSQSVQLYPPKLRSLHDDPSERHFVEILPGSRYGDIVSIMDAAKRDHEGTIGEVQSSMTRISMAWRPWLQPCCKLPWCQCKEER